MALKLLRHEDLFERCEGVPVADAGADAVPRADDGTAASLAQADKDQAQLQAEQNTLMDLHDSVNSMGKAELTQYALTNFKQTLDKNLKVADMRAQVHQALDQFGAA